MAVKPDTFESLCLKGIAAGRARRPAEAAEWFARAAALQPRNGEVQFNLGVALGESGRPLEALAAYERAVAIDPARPDAHYNLGVVLDALGRTDEALGAYERATVLTPAHAEAQHNRGVALARLGRSAEALEAFDHALAARPRYAAAHNHRGAALAALGRPEDAVTDYDRALAIAPDYAPAHNHRAIALLELDRAGEALANAERAAALAPRFADAWYTRGNALRELNRHADAMDSYRRAIALEPRHASAHWNLADTLLLTGDFARGWDEYAWRWTSPAAAVPAARFRQPLWLGDKPLAGRVLLLHNDMGMGDVLLYCRYVRDLALMGAEVVLEVEPPLVPLLASLEGAALVVPRGAALPAFDYHCPVLALPLVFRIDLRSAPDAGPYIRSDPARVAYWRAQLGERRRPRVAFVWSGSRGLRNDKRSLDLAHVLPLLSIDVDWISLQKELREGDAELLAEHPGIRCLGADLGGFDDTAAVLDIVDALVTVDTAVANLAGAMGRPVWVLLPFSASDWRWLLAREDSPWYPSARLVRQPARGDWASVVASVRAELEPRYGSR